jgi:zinc D-Ala-D-Ala carboxypeptidase
MKMYKYFTEDELKCSHTGECKMDKDFMKVLDEIREECGFAFVITSGYRSPKHPIEAKKSRPGAHASGKAVDILVHMEQAYKVVEVALRFGIKRIGVSQKGDVGARFIHLDMDETRASPRIWSY